MSFGDGASIAPAGWYPDPADDARLRRWDGQKWTPDVILAPEQEPVGFVPPHSVPTRTETMWSPAPPVVEQPPASPQAAPEPASAPPPPQTSVPSSVPPPPPTSVPGVPSPLASSPPPTAPSSGPARTGPSQPGAAHSPAPGMRGAGPAAAERPNPPSGPVSLPEWGNLPGLTLPPDLTGIPGLEPEPVLKAPTFEEPQKPALRTPDWNAQPVSKRPPQTPDPVANFGLTPARNYAPAPAGVQYDVPPPPGAERIPSAGPVLPASSFTAPRMPEAAWSPSPGALQGAAVAPLAIGAPSRIPSAPAGGAQSSGALTIWVWLIALLPLIQFGVVYLVFTVLGSEFEPGMQWGILAAPAAFSLLFAIGDGRVLANADVERAPSPLLAIVPPIYLLVRAVDVGRSSAIALVAWFVFQAVAAAGVYYLLPHVLALAIKAVG